MKIDAYLHLVPEIERRIKEANIDTLVFGLGPTAWLLPWLDHRLVRDLSLWTSHDGCKIMPADDLLLLDGPILGLHPDTERYAQILRSRPKRIWCLPSAWGKEGKEDIGWRGHMPDSIKGIVTMQDFRVWDPNLVPHMIQPELAGTTNPRTKMHVPDTYAISPIGCVTMAWMQGARRIGLLGVDILKDHGHSSYPRRHGIDQFLTTIAQQASAMGGVIANLSPVTSLTRFAAWTPSASSSAPTSGSETPGPKPCSNTAFVLARPATFPLPGCDPAIPAGKSAS